MRHIRVVQGHTPSVQGLCKTPACISPPALVLHTKGARRVSLVSLVRPCISSVAGRTVSAVRFGPCTHFNRCKELAVWLRLSSCNLALGLKIEDDQNKVTSPLPTQAYEQYPYWVLGYRFDLHWAICSPRELQKSFKSRPRKWMNLFSRLFLFPSLATVCYSWVPQLPPSILPTVPKLPPRVQARQRG